MSPAIRFPSATTYRAGQGGEVDDRVGRLLGARKGVGQDQPALGVGVQDLDGLAAAIVSTSSG